MVRRNPKSSSLASITAHCGREMLSTTKKNTSQEQRWKHDALVFTAQGDLDTSVFLCPLLSNRKAVKTNITLNISTELELEPRPVQCGFLCFIHLELAVL